MYLATSARACSRVGYTVRLTRSTFSAALNDSACALSKHDPVRPTERRMSSSAAARANASQVYLGATIGMEDRAVGQRVVAGCHLQRIDHQVGAHVVGERVANAFLGAA